MITFKADKKTLYFFYLTIISPNLLLLLFNKDDFITSEKIFIYSIFTIGLLIFTKQSFNFLKIKNKYYYLFLLPLLIISPLENYYIIKYGTPITSEILSLIIETSISEAFEYLLGLIYFITPAIIIPILAFLYLYKKNNSNSKLNIKTLITSLLLVFSTMFYYSSKGEDIITNSYPFGYFFRVTELIKEHQKITMMINSTSHFKFNAHFKENKLPPKLFVIVIGESSRKENWQLFGYHRPTTPFLSQQQNLITFNNFLSVTSLTRTSVPIMLTRKTAKQANDSFFNEKSLISAFNEAGFNSTWLSMQISLGTHDTPITVYAKEANNLYYFNQTSFQQNSNKHDTAMLSFLKTKITHIKNNSLIIIHTLGSHFNYAYRYPQNFDLFKPSLKNIKFANLYDSKHKIEHINSYDNSILFTDYFLKQVINMINQSNISSILFYASDHGESLFDGECPISGHGLETKQNFEIPALLWYSQQYAKENQDKINAAFHNQNKKINSENIFYSMLDLANISYDKESTVSSFASRSFVEKDRFINQFKMINFDKSMFINPCQEISAQ